ncbi:MAG: hypothetical protein AVDCRST_MAG89-5013, partial [uncultured Gemmatimonadetes bacterium]
AGPVLFSPDCAHAPGPGPGSAARQPRQPVPPGVAGRAARGVDGAVRRGDGPPARACGGGVEGRGGRRGARRRGDRRGDGGGAGPRVVVRLRKAARGAVPPGRDDGAGPPLRAAL